MFASVNKITLAFFVAFKNLHLYDKSINIKTHVSTQYLNSVYSPFLGSNPCCLKRQCTAGGETAKHQHTGPTKTLKKTVLKVLDSLKLRQHVW